MIIAWQAVNKARRPNAKNFSDAFLIVTPGITIRDRLRVLNPSDPSNSYEFFDLVPSDLMDAVRRARIVITNYHAFMLREKEQVSKLNRQILGGLEGEKRFTETEGEMIARLRHDGGLARPGRHFAGEAIETRICLRVRVLDIFAELLRRDFREPDQRFDGLTLTEELLALAKRIAPVQQKTLRLRRNTPLTGRQRRATDRRLCGLH